METVNNVIAAVLAEYSDIAQVQRDEITTKLSQILNTLIDGYLEAAELDVVYDRYGKDVSYKVGD